MFRNVGGGAECGRAHARVCGRAAVLCAERQRLGYRAGVHLGDALLSRLAPLSGWYQRLRPCFPGDMAVRTRTGWRRWDAVTAGEEVATCDEHDPHGPIVFRPIEEVFRG